LQDFNGQLLILPEVTEVSTAEKELLAHYAENGGRVVSTGTTPLTSCGSKGVTCLKSSPQSVYFEALKRDFSTTRTVLPQEFVTSIALKTDIVVDAPATVAANFGKVNGTPHIFLVNFTGIVAGKTVIPTLSQGIRVKIPASTGDSMAFLPFLGEVRTVRGTRQGDTMEFVLPPVERSAVVWLAAKK
jgi:hypothetical protein